MEFAATLVTFSGKLGSHADVDCVSKAFRLRRTEFADLLPQVVKRRGFLDNFRHGVHSFLQNVIKITFGVRAGESVQIPSSRKSYKEFIKIVEPEGDCCSYRD